MPRVTDFTKAFDVTPNTVRAWSKEFGYYLSSGANPTKGKTRTYTDEDAAVVTLVAGMRDNSASFDEIRAALEDNDRGQWPPDSVEGPGQADSMETGQMAIVTRLTATVAQFEGELGAVKEERDRLLVLFETEREARIEAGYAAARAAGQLAAIYRRHWWQVWRPERPGG